MRSFSKLTPKILDIGCGNGNFVRFLKSEGYESFGYDKSRNIQKYLRVKNVPIYKNMRDIPNHYFNVVTCFDVIEHTADPRILIRSIKEKLNKNGIAMITTPNAQGFSSRILRHNWWVFGPTAHFILFSVRSLRLLLLNEGFELLHMSTDP